MVVSKHHMTLSKVPHEHELLVDGSFEDGCFVPGDVQVLRAAVLSAEYYRAVIWLTDVQQADGTVRLDINLPYRVDGTTQVVTAQDKGMYMPAETVHLLDSDVNCVFRCNFRSVI